MNTANNARSAASKQAIKAAFLQILNEKIPRDICVQEVCKLANINRSTFYAHFTNINELLNELEVDLYKQAKQSIFLRNLDFMQLTSRDTILKILKFIRQHESLYRKYYLQLTDSAHMTMLSNHVKETYVSALSTYNASYSKEEIDYSFEFCKQGTHGVIRKWLISGCEEPEEQIALLLERLLLKSLP